MRVYPTLESDIPDMQAAVAQAQQQEHTQVRSVVVQGARWCAAGYRRTC